MTPEYENKISPIYLIQLSNIELRQKQLQMFLSC